MSLGMWVTEGTPTMNFVFYITMWNVCAMQLMQRKYRQNRRYHVILNIPGARFNSSGTPSFYNLLPIWRIIIYLQFRRITIDMYLIILLIFGYQEMPHPANMNKNPEVLYKIICSCKFFKVRYQKNTSVILTSF